MHDPAADLDWYLDNVVVPSGPEHRELGPIRRWAASWESAATTLSRKERPAIVQTCLRQGFVLTTGQLAEAGFDRAEYRRMLRRGAWESVGRGVVALTPSANARPASLAARIAAQRRRHAVTAAGAALVRPGHGVSGASAAVLHGLPTMSVPAVPVLTTARAATLGHAPRAVVRCAALAPSEVTEWFGTPCTTLARTIVDLARSDRRDGLLAADAALREAVVTRAEVEAVLERCRGWPGTVGAREIVALADPLSESSLESLTRLALHDAGLPTPQLQAEIRDPSTGRRYRVDFLWPEHRVILEADGRSKYTGDELWREKRRELALSRLGYRIERVTWDDVVVLWRATEARLRRVLAASPTG